MKMNTCPTSARFGACVMLAATASVAQAANLEYRASAGVGHTDNVRREAAGMSDETLAIADLRFSFDAETRRLTADVVGELAYHDFLDNTYDSEVVGNVHAETVFALVPERFAWVVGDDFGQVLLDPFQPSTPDNRQNINILTTGPDFFVGLGSQMRLRMSGRYSLATYEDDPLDSTMTAGEIGLIRSVSDRSALSLNGRMQQTEYDEQALGADFDQTDLYLRYQAEGARTNLAIDVGYSELEREASNDSEGGPRVNIDVSRRISEASVIEFVGTRRFATAATEFADDDLGVGDVGLDTVPGRQTADPFTLDEATLSWTFGRSRTSFTTMLNWSRREYDENPALDQSLRLLGVRVSRDLSATTSIDLNASYEDVDYADPSPDYDLQAGGLGFRWRLTRNLVFEAEYDFYRRDNKQADTSATENRFLVKLGWGHGEPRRGRLAPRFGVDPQTRRN